jgi:hypothetical protein
MHRIILSLSLMAVVAGCADPLRDVPKLQDMDIDAGAGQVDALADPAGGDVSGVTVEDLPQVAVSEEKPRGGLLGFLGRKADAVTEAAPEEAPVDLVDGQNVDISPEVAAQAEAARISGREDIPEQADANSPIVLAALALDEAPAPKKKRGLFGAGLGGTGGKTKSGRAPKIGDPDYEQVKAGTTLPYGRLARICGVSKAQLGSKAGSWPERGRGYTLYDSAPGGIGQRTFYLTGFDDGCARQFTAALVMFASPESYEAIHYGPSGKSQPVSDTDRAYEKIKSKVCRVKAGKPCGSSMKKLSKDTVFVTVYERFGGSPRWKNLLLHDGEVAALDIKG